MRFEYIKLLSLLEEKEIKVYFSHLGWIINSSLILKGFKFSRMMTLKGAPSNRKLIRPSLLIITNEKTSDPCWKEATEEILKHINSKSFDQDAEQKVQTIIGEYIFDQVQADLYKKQLNNTVEPSYTIPSKK